MRYRILAAGNLSGFSEVPAHLFSALAKKHDIVDIIDTKFSGFWNYYNYLYCFWKLPNPTKWLHPVHTIFGGEFSAYRPHTKYYCLKTTEDLQRKIQKVNKEYDIIFQAGALPIRNEHGKHYCAYTDSTPKQIEREYPPWAKFFSDKDKKICEKIVDEAYQNASKIFTTSNYARDSIINDYGIDEEKVITVYNGVNIDELPTFNKSYNKKVLFVGKGNFEAKGGTTLLKAFNEVRKEIKDVKLIIVGSNLPIKEEGVIVRGYIDRSDPVQSSELLQLYKEASVFVLPSKVEAFGIALLEAMAYKTPCIGSSVGGIPEVIKDRETGFLVPPNDYKQLADKLVLLLENENLMKKMGEEGRKRVEKYFTWDLVVDRIIEQFENILR